MIHPAQQAKDVMKIKGGKKRQDRHSKNERLMARRGKQKANSQTNTDRTKRKNNAINLRKKSYNDTHIHTHTLIHTVKVD